VKAGTLEYGGTMSIDEMLKERVKRKSSESRKARIKEVTERLDKIRANEFNYEQTHFTKVGGVVLVE